ncbi:MAG: M12 family metallo-peptidase, partial [Bacteroidota bacterium]
MLLAFSTIQAQQHQHSPVAEQVAAAKTQKQSFHTVSLLSSHSRDEKELRETLAKAVADFQLVDFTLGTFSLAEAPETIQFIVPSDEEDILLELVKVQILADDFTLITSESNEQPVPYSTGVHYRGIVAGRPHSTAAISIFEEEIMGVISINQRTHILGRLEGPQKQEGLHILYKESDLLGTQDFECGTESKPLDKEEQRLMQQIANGEFAHIEKSNKCIQVYLELEYNLVSQKGGEIGALNFMAGLWNMVATIYQNENITTTISQVFAWTTPDNYPTSSSSLVLANFRATRPNFNGDLAHLVSTGAPAGVGVAYVGGLCNSLNYAYSWIQGSYAQVPTYSWSVNVLAHEMGHNLGSRHTHDCIWNNNNTPIDGCGPAANYSTPCTPGPLPTNGGTVMSYCHLLGNIGINFNNGFGQQPGDLIRANIANASCLTNCANLGCPVLSLQADGVTCFGDTDGSASVSAQGGVPPYTYQWSNGATTPAITNLAGGNYSVTVTDANNCSKVGVAFIDEPGQLQANPAILNATGANNGLVNLRAIGGQTPYTYTWSIGGNTAYQSNLGPGTYQFTITDANGCTTNDSLVIIDEMPSCSLNVIRVTVQSDNFPDEVGYALGDYLFNTLDQISPFDHIVPPGGVVSRNYCLPDGCYAFGILDFGSNGLCNSQSTPPGFYLIENLNTGDTIAFNCDFGFNIREDFCIGAPLSISVSSTDVSCTGDTDGTATVTAVDGAGAYTYAWNTGGTTATINNLTPGTYSVTVTSGWYRDSLDVVVGEPSLLTVNVSSTNANLGNNGSATASSSGGTQPYSYTWTNGGTTATINNLGAGTYSVTVTDANQCTVIDSIEVIEEVTGLETVAEATNVSCFGANDGTVSVTAYGGNGTYAYTWSNGATTATVTGLGPGTYFVTVTSGNQTNPYSVAVVNEPTAVSVTIAGTNATGGNNNGSATATVTGGTPPYLYAWSNGDSTATI